MWRQWLVYVAIEVEADSEEAARATVEMSLFNEFCSGYEIQRVET